MYHYRSYLRVEPIHLNTYTHSEPAAQAAETMCALLRKGIKPGKHVFVYICIFIYIYICIYIYVYVYLSVCMFIYVYVYVYIYILIHDEPAA